MSATELVQLRQPIPYQDLEWRVLRAGVKSSGGVWALLTPYVTARVVMERLDHVVGPDRWQTSRPEQWQGGAIIGIGIKVGEEWVWKWDGSEAPTEKGDDGPQMALKGSLSGALKRAAVAWGIGRELYAVGDVWATVTDQGANRARFKDKKSGNFIDYHWSPPTAQEWATLLRKAGIESPKPAEQAEDPILKITKQINKLRPFLHPQEAQALDDAIFAGACAEDLTREYKKYRALAEERRAS